MANNRLIVGIDPGTGASSPTGLGIFDPDTREILLSEAVRSKRTATHQRIRDIALHVEKRLAYLDPAYDVTVYIESTVMRGASGETLARMTGALMASVRPEFEFDFVQNITVKLLVGGSGKADKQQVAAGVADFFGPPFTPESLISSSQVLTLLSTNKWDQLDALAIGIAGLKGGGKAFRRG